MTTTCHCGRTKANHEPSMHRFTARPQVKETQMPNPATEQMPVTEAGRAMLRDPMYRFAIGHITAIEQEAAAGSAPDEERVDEPEVIRIMSKIVEAMRFDAIPAIAVLAGRKKNGGAAFTLRHLRSLVDEYDAALTDSRP